VDSRFPDLDASMFTRHPDGYICRCGLPEHCVCPTDFPEAVVADLAAELKRLRDGIEEIADDNSPHDAQYGAYLVADEWRR